MSLNVTTSIKGGFSRVATRNGLLLISAYAVVGLIWQVTLNSLLVQGVTQFAPEAADASLGMLSVNLPLAVLAVLAFVLFLVLQYMALVATRILVGGYERSIPNDLLTRNVPLAIVNLFVGGIVYSALVAIGSVLLVIPGIIAYLAFVFMTVFIAVEDENFVAALGDSWSLTRGNWLRLFLLFVIIGVIGGVLGVLFSIGSMLSPAASTILSVLVFLPFSVLSLGILAEAFVQLRDESSPAATTEAI